jgi:hypothetical protein
VYVEGQLDQGDYLTREYPKTRLKVGIGFLATGLILQFLIEIYRASEQSVSSGAYLTCITYGGLGNDCSERFAVSSNPLGWILAFIGFFIVIGHFTGKIASDKGRDYSNYFWLGFLLGLIGLLIVALMGDQNPKKVKLVEEGLIEDQKKCKYCAEYVKIDAIFCKHCKNNLN